MRLKHIKSWLHLQVIEKGNVTLIVSDIKDHDLPLCISGQEHYKGLKVSKLLPWVLSFII